MKDEMKDIDQLFREKLGASSGKYQAGYWTKMEALLAGNGASALWRNVRNASMLLLVAGILAIDFLVPKETLRYNHKNTAVPATVVQETTIASAAEPVAENQILVTEKTVQGSAAPEQTKITSTNPGKKETAQGSIVKSDKPDEHSSEAIVEEMTISSEENVAQQVEETVAEEIENKAGQTEEVAVASNEDLEANEEKQETEGTESSPVEELAETAVLAAEDEIGPLLAKDAASRFFIGATAYGGSALRMLSSDDGDLVTRKEAEEKAGLYTSTQVHLGYSFGNWSIITGIGQWTQEEKLSYTNQLNGSLPVDNGFWDINSQTITTVDSNWVIAGIYQGYWNYDSTSVTYLDSTYVTQWDTAFGAYDTSMAQYNGAHRLRYIEVPIMASCRLQLNKFDLEFSAGMSFGFYSASSGKSYLNAEQSAVLNSGDQKALFQSPVYSALFGVGIAYPISRHWELLAQAQGRYTMNSVTTPNAWIQRYLQYGLGAGVRFRF